MEKDYVTLSELKELYTIAHARANDEYNQHSFNAAWLHGYADALHKLIQRIENPGN